LGTALFRGPLGIKHRWWVLLFILLNVIGLVLVKPVRPHIQVAPEKISARPLFTLPVIGEFYLTNTLTMLVVVVLVIVLMAWLVHASLKKGSLAPGGLAGVVEAGVEVLYNLTETSAGRYTRSVFPWFATFIIFVLVGNLLKLTPIVETFGELHVAQEGGHPIQMVWPGAYTVLPGEVAPGETGYLVTPWFRGVPTDLNFTLALALISLTMTQVVGLRAQGARYLLKFFNVVNLFKKPFFGAMDFLVSLLELISELAKILSFAFRLFGNMFAGAVLLFLVGSLIPIFLQSFVVLFEVFVGAIQAFVFGMLTMVFMAQATHGHSAEPH